MLAEERERMHPLPKMPHTVCFGQTRKVSPDSTISIGSAIYSVPSMLVEERVWTRAHGSEMIVVHVDSPDGPCEVARHALTTLHAQWPSPPGGLDLGAGEAEHQG